MRHLTLPGPPDGACLWPAGSLGALGAPEASHRGPPSGAGAAQRRRGRPAAPARAPSAELVLAAARFNQVLGQGIQAAVPLAPHVDWDHPVGNIQALRQ